MGYLQSLMDFSTVWIRYDAYVLRLSERGERYILPADGANFTLYDPFAHSEELLSAVLALGQVAERCGDDSVETEAALLSFAAGFGLLGLVTTGVYSRDIVGEKTVLLNERNVTGRSGMVDGESYWRLFAPFAEEEELCLRRYKRGVDLRKAEDSPKFYGKRPLVMEVVFSKFYAEQTAWILDFAKNMVRHFEMLLVYQAHRATLTEAVEIMPEFFQPERISFTIVQEERTRLKWQADALRTVVEMVYGLLVSEEETLLRKCPYCGKIFIAHHRKEKYCSPSCRNCANVLKSRQRHSQEEKNDGKNA